MLQYAAIAGGVILVLLLVVVLAKATKRSSNKAGHASEVQIPTTIELPEEGESASPALDEDLDDFWADLDGGSKPDEFDDMFDDL